MTKKEIVKRISEEAKLTQLKTKEVVQMTFDAIIDTLVTEGRIELRNFGVFEVKRRKPRRARNPRTNEPVEVDAKNVVTFQPGKVMEEKVRRMQSGASPGELGKSNPDRDGFAAEDDDNEEMQLPVGASYAVDGEFNQPSSGQPTEDNSLPRKPR